MQELDTDVLLDERHVPQDGPAVPAEPGWCYRPLSHADVDGTVVEHFTASPRTSSAWGPHMQHGGPVTALLVRALERLGDTEGRRISRVTTDLFGWCPWARSA